LYFRSGRGSRLWDVDGNEYIDYVLAWGPLILGHCHQRLVEAAVSRATLPHIYGAQHELEYEVSERIQRLVPCAERVMFTSSGSEAVQAALRLARAHTGRNLVVKFEGHYHGWMDSVLVSYHPAPDEIGLTESPRSVLGSGGQVANCVENLLIAPWNDLAPLQRLLSQLRGAVAAIITEPVLCNSGSIMPEPGYLEGLRSLANEHGALLVFDEIITGFRMGSGGAQSWFGVTPDLATFGKALGGGFTLSAITGRKDIMELIADGVVAFGGTFNGNPISLAAAKATIDELCRDDDAALRHANRMGAMLMQGMRDAAREQSVPLVVTGFGAALSVHFSSTDRMRCYRDFLRCDESLRGWFLRQMLEEGILMLPDGRMYVSAAHSLEDIETTIRAARRVLSRAPCGATECPLP
jgi:glutamate-1-semialdehyde 2,1-aminomutase